MSTGGQDERRIVEGEITPSESVGALRQLTQELLHERVVSRLRIKELEEMLGDEVTRHHALRWVLGLEAHEGEVLKQESQSITNLRTELARIQLADDRSDRISTYPGETMKLEQTGLGLVRNELQSAVQCTENEHVLHHLNGAVAGLNAFLDRDLPLLLTDAFRNGFAEFYAKHVIAGMEEERSEDLQCVVGTCQTERVFYDLENQEWVCQEHIPMWARRPDEFG